MIALPEMERCACGHSCLLHYCKEDSDGYAGCIITKCTCQEYKPDSGGTTEGQRAEEK